MLSPTLFNIYTSDIPEPPPHVHLLTYADDITLHSSFHDYTTAQQRLQPYLRQIVKWTKDNDLVQNADKTMITLFTPDLNEYSKTISLTIDDTILPTCRHSKILELTFDLN